TLLNCFVSEAIAPRRRHLVWASVRNLTGPVLVWALWGAMTAAAVLLIRQYARNVPYMDDFALVPVMTGHAPLSVGWIWSRHGEPRPAVARLILAALYRYVARDFRAGMYANAGLMSAAAAAMLVLARRIRGHTSVADVVLPLSILNVGQAETLLIGFALNLVLS